MTLSDFQVQLADGTVVGAGTTVGLASISGLRALPDLRNGDEARGGSDGMMPSNSLLGDRVVTFSFQIFDPTAGLEASIQKLSSNWQNTRSASDAVMTVGDYLTQLAIGGAKPVSSLQVKLPGRSDNLLLLGRPSRFGLPVDASYQYKAPTIGAEWTVPDGALYDATLVTGSCGLPNPVSGFTFPATPPFTFGTSTGGSVQVTNAGEYDANPVIKITGPCTRPRVTHGASGRFIQLNIVLQQGDLLTVDMQGKAVTYNGSNRNNIVGAGSSFFTLPPGSNTVQFSSQDQSLVTGQMAVYLLNTYSVI